MEADIKILEEELGRSIDVEDLLDWYERLRLASDRIDALQDRIHIRYVLYLYLLYRDMYGTTAGPIEEDMLLLIDNGKILVHEDGIDRTMYLYNHQSVDDYILLIRDSVREIEVVSADDIHSSHLELLPQLHTIIITPTEELRRMSINNEQDGEIDLDDYTEEIPNGLENISIKISRSTR